MTPGELNEIVRLHGVKRFGNGDLRDFTRGKQMAKKKPDTTKVLFLRTSEADMTAHSGFVWPRKGPVECADWSPVAQCGNGLHGSLWGAGNSSHYSTAIDAVWQVVEGERSLCVDLGGKHKFPKGVVLFSGDMRGAVDFLCADPRTPVDAKVYGAVKNGGNGSTVTGGNRSTVTGGYDSTVTGGHSSTVTGGDRSTVTGGYDSTVSGGDDSTVTGGNRSTVTGGYASTVTGGHSSTVTGWDRSTVTGGYDSTVTGGHSSTVTGGDRSTVTGGYASTVTGGNGSTVTGGDDSAFSILFWDTDKSRYRRRVAEVDGVNILPNVPYVLNEKGEFMRKEVK